MAILSYKLDAMGESGVSPSIIRIETNNTLAEVTATGFLNSLVEKAGTYLSEDMMALVSTKTSPSATATQVAWLEISYSAGNWSLVANNSQLTLADGDIFVGNADNVATGVTMSGDATIDNAGALTIADEAVELDMLAPGIEPSHIVKYAGKEANDGNSATIAITVTGVLATDVVFAQLEASSNLTTIVNVTPSADTITVLLNGDPGPSTIIAYQALRAAA